jgi:hypothetical protein
MRTFRLASYLILLVGVFHSTTAAQESVHDSRTAPSSATDLRSPSDSLGLHDTGELSQEPQVAGHTLPAFFADSDATLNLRTFYFSRDERREAPTADVEKEAWALGGSVAYKSGKIAEVADVSAELFTSQKLYGPHDKDGSLLLEPGQDGYTVLGVLNPRAEFQGHVLSLFRQRHDFPYINGQDNRMTPNTFESYSYGFIGEDGNAPLKFGIGYFDKIKKRNSDTFISMSEATGATEIDRGMPWAGLRYTPNNQLKVGVVDYVLLDTLNIAYSDFSFTQKLDEKVEAKISAQYSSQTQIGDKLLGNPEDETSMSGLQGALSFDALLIRAALTYTESDGAMISPFGSYPGYNSSIVEDFNRAGEIAWKVGFSFDLEQAGFEGVSAYLDYIRGNRAVGADRQALRDKEEIDLNFDYRPSAGELKGFWFRFRNALVREDGGGTTTDLRIILNYGFEVL